MYVGTFFESQNNVPLFSFFLIFSNTDCLVFVALVPSFEITSAACLKFGVEMASQASTTGVNTRDVKNEICFPCNLSDDIRTRLMLKFGIVGDISFTSINKRKGEFQRRSKSDLENRLIECYQVAAV